MFRIARSTVRASLFIGAVAALTLLCATACTSTTEPTSLLSPLGHEWTRKANPDASAEHAPGAAGGAVIAWCVLHNHIPRGDAELMDATRWLAMHP